MTKPDDEKSSSAIRVLLVNVGFVPQVGGSYRLLYEAARHLPPGSIDVLTSHSPGDKSFESAGVRIVRSWALTLRDPEAMSAYTRRIVGRHGASPFFRLMNLAVRRWIGVPAAFLRALIQTVAVQYDFVIAGQALPSGWIGVGLKRLRKLAFGTFVYGEEVAFSNPGRRMTQLLSSTLREAVWVIACSAATRSKTIEWGCDAAKVHTLLPGVDTELFQPLERVADQNRETRVVLSVGRLIPQKGFDRVIRALPSLRKVVPAVKYLVRGDGPELHNLLRLAEEIGVSDCFEILPEVPYEELRYLYSQADVLVLPNIVAPGTGEQEGFGLVLLEAGSCGCPVIAGASGGVSDAVSNGQTGLLVDPLDPDSLSKAIIAILTNPELRAELGIRARKRAIEEFSWRHYSEQLWDLILGEVGRVREVDRLAS